MADKQIELIAHLARRAGFGATREELEEYAKRYEAIGNFFFSLSIPFQIWWAWPFCSSATP